MNETKTVKYTCPYCSREFEADIYDAVNAADRELRDRVVSGDLFRVSCPHCKKDFMIQYPLVYIDNEHRFLLWLSTQDAGEMLKGLTKPLTEQGYVLRRCETLAEMAEKIQILEDGVSDVMVELAKYDCFIEFIDNKKGKAEDVTSVEYQKTENEVMKINVRTDDRGMAFLIPLQMLEEEMAQNPERYEVDNETIPVINSAWITSLFMPSEGTA
ncbi:MAG: CpXC domain-containing protein [Solobacterium sp.]|nr:CpXC domain-containing protein [Solobacterium sp.]